VPQCAAGENKCLSHATAISGISEICGPSGGNYLAISLPTNLTYASFNRFYEFASSQAINTVATANTTTKLRWDVKASFTFEVD
jgi:hypothetical protein